MMEPGGEIDHVFGCSVFPVNQITEHTQRRTNTRDERTQNFVCLNKHT